MNGSGNQEIKPNAGGHEQNPKDRRADHHIAWSDEDWSAAVSRRREA